MKPGRSLDALVAEKVTGSKPRTISGATKDKGESWAVIQDAMNGPFYTDNDVRDWIESVQGYELMHIHYYPKYSTDIAAAWQVVEKLGSEKFMFDLKRRYSICGWGWDAEFADYNWKEYEADGVTAPHAICLAALKAVGWDEGL